MFSFDFDALDEELDSAEPHQAEVASPWIIDGPEASRPVEDTAPYKALDSAEPHQAELASPLIIDRPEASSIYAATISTLTPHIFTPPQRAKPFCRNEYAALK